MHAYIPIHAYIITQNDGTHRIHTCIYTHRIHACIYTPPRAEFLGPQVPGRWGPLLTQLLLLHMHVYMYVCMYVCIYVHMYVFMYVYTYVCKYVHLVLRLLTSGVRCWLGCCFCTSMCICMYVCMYVRTYIRTYVSMCIWSSGSWPVGSTADSAASSAYVCTYVCILWVLNTCAYGFVVFSKRKYKQMYVCICFSFKGNHKLTF